MPCYLNGCGRQRLVNNFLLVTKYTDCNLRKCPNDVRKMLNAPIKNGNFDMLKGVKFGLHQLVCYQIFVLLQPYRRDTTVPLETKIPLSFKAIALRDTHAFALSSLPHVSISRAGTNLVQLSKHGCPPNNQDLTAFPLTNMVVIPGARLSTNFFRSPAPRRTADHFLS